jgi:hypothetical protein
MQLVVSQSVSKKKRDRSAQTSHSLLDTIVLLSPLSSSLCSVPTTVSAVIGNEERGPEGPCGTACCHSWVPTPFRPSEVWEVDVTARSDVSAVPG